MAGRPKRRARLAAVAEADGADPGQSPDSRGGGFRDPKNAGGVAGGPESPTPGGRDKTGSAPEWYRPPRPFEVQHGAGTAEVYGPIAERLRNAVVVERPDLASAEFEQALWAWSVAEARCHLYRRHAERVGELDPDGNPHPWVNTWNRAETAAGNQRKRLGLDPVSSVQLLKDRATVSVLGVDLQQMLSHGREVLESRRGELGPGEGSDGDPGGDLR